MIFNMAGGRQERKSAIIVTAPAGSEVTCSMGGVTKTAREENGVWSFWNLELGTWRVEAGLGEKQVSREIALTRLSVEYITLSYTEYVIQNGYIDLAAHPCSGSCDVAYSYNGTGVLRMYIGNGEQRTYSFSNVTVPASATRYTVEYIRLPMYEYDAYIAVGEARAYGGGHDPGTLTLDVTALQGTTATIRFSCGGYSGGEYAMVRNAYFT